MSTLTPVALKGVVKAFGEHPVLRHFTLNLCEGTVTAMTGPNGSGKTTIARLLLGLETADSGEIHGLAGRRCAAVFQEDRLCPQLSARENVRLVLDTNQWPLAQAHLTRVGLGGDSLTKPVRELSGGQRRRVAIVRALAGEPDLVILDEPFTGLDAHCKPEIMRYVRERIAGRTVLLVTHDLAEAAWFGARVVVVLSEASRESEGPG